MIVAANRLRRHGEYQRVYRSSRKRFGKQMSYFFLLREPQSIKENGMPAGSICGPRVGFTVGRPMGNAVVRNRIKRRMREAVRRQIPILQAAVDVILHPSRRVSDIEFALLEQDVAQVFRAIQQAVERGARPDGRSRVGEHP